MRSLLAIGVATLFLLPQMGLAQTATGMGADATGTGHVTVGSHPERARSPEERQGYDLDSDDVQTQSPPRAEGPDVRFH